MTTTTTTTRRKRRDSSTQVIGDLTEIPRSTFHGACTRIVEQRSSPDDDYATSCQTHPPINPSIYPSSPNQHHRCTASRISFDFDCAPSRNFHVAVTAKQQRGKNHQKASCLARPSASSSTRSSSSGYNSPRFRWQGSFCSVPPRPGRPWSRSVRLSRLHLTR